MHKYKNTRFLDDADNQTYIIDPENLEFKGTTRSNNQYCVVRYPLNWRDGDNLDLLISRDINDGFMVIIKGVEQDPDMGVKIVHPSIDDDSKATYSDKEENNDYNSHKTTYDGENMTAYSDYQGNNDENSPETPYDGENMNASSDDEGNNDEVSPDPPTDDININANYDDEKKEY